jgi:hypothetical protein
MYKVAIITKHQPARFEALNATRAEAAFQPQPLT